MCVCVCGCNEAEHELTQLLRDTVAVVVAILLAVRQKAVLI